MYIISIVLSVAVFIIPLVGLANDSSQCLNQPAEFKDKLVELLKTENEPINKFKSKLNACEQVIAKDLIKQQQEALQFELQNMLGYLTTSSKQDTENKGVYDAAYTALKMVFDKLDKQPGLKHQGEQCLTRPEAFKVQLMKQITINEKATSNRSLEDFQTLMQTCDQSIADNPSKDKREVLRNQLELVQNYIITQSILKPGSDSQKFYQEAQKTLRSTSAFTANTPLKLIDWGKDRFYSFYAGFEGATNSQLENRNTTRVGFMAYSQICGPFGNRKDVKKCDIWGPFDDLHYFGNILLTTTGESENLGQNTANSTVEEALELDLNVFFANEGVVQSVGALALGPIVATSLSRVDGSNSVIRKNYIGYRFASSPEAYLDILYGKTERVRGRRAEFRFQLPIGVLGTGRIFVGANVNIGVSDYAGTADSTRIYGTWQVNFDEFF